MLRHSSSLAICLLLASGIGACNSGDKTPPTSAALEPTVASLEPVARDVATPPPSLPVGTKSPGATSDQVSPAPAAQPATSRPSTTVATTGRSHAQPSTGRAPRPSPAPARPAPSRPGETSELAVQRLVVAEGIADREPQEENTRFGASNEGLYAFAELANDRAAARRVSVVFRHEGGREVGHVELEIPGNVPRWRTWARSHLVTQPGQWRAILRNADGTELASAAFTVE